MEEADGTLVKSRETTMMVPMILITTMGRRKWEFKLNSSVHLRAH